MAKLAKFWNSAIFDGVLSCLDKIVIISFVILISDAEKVKDALIHFFLVSFQNSFPHPIVASLQPDVFVPYQRMSMDVSLYAARKIYLTLASSRLLAASFRLARLIAAFICFTIAESAVAFRALSCSQSTMLISYGYCQSLDKLKDGKGIHLREYKQVTCSMTD